MATEDERKLFVAGLPESITEEMLSELFAATGGSVVEVSLPRDRTTGRSRGFGFVTLSNGEEAAAARTALDGSIQGGRSMSVRAFQAEALRRNDTREGAPRSPGAERDRGGGDRTLYVGNLPYDCTQQELEELFAQHRVGPIQRVHLPAGPDGRLRGYGFVTMATTEATQAAIEALRSADLRGRRLMVNVAHPRGERPERSNLGPNEAPQRPARDAGVDPRGFGSSPFPSDAPPPNFSEGDRGAEGRRRAAERVDRGDKKKKKKGRGERVIENTRRGREGRIEWDDWDKEK
jgi:RNA recognition motif-containing protein